MPLAAVALILSLLTAVSVTYSWIDDVKQVEFDNDNVTDNGAPLKSGVDINSDIVITKGENSINLGNILQNSDLMIDNYNYGTQENPDVRAHTKYENVQSPSWPDVNKKKGYFYESGDMHLSGCYSDGETFYFPRQGANVNGYREGNKDDENVNYISFTARVSSPDANVDFWFKELPAVKDSKTQNDIANARFAITVDGDHHVYSSGGYANTIDGGNPSPVSGVRKTSVYTYGNQENTTASRGANSNVLFSVKKGGTVNLNIKIWLEPGFDTTITASDINLNLVSSWAYERNITIIDQTSSCKYIGTNDNTNSSWLGSEPLYLTLPDVLNEMCKKKYGGTPTCQSWSFIKSEEGFENAPFYDLRTTDTNLVETGTTSEGFTYYTVKKVPLVYKNETMMIFRNQNGWYSGNYTTGSDNYSVKCYNWWKTSLPDTFTNDSYRLYGGSHDAEAFRYFKDDVDNKNKTFQGYGTWGEIIKIQVDAKTKALSTTEDVNKTEEVNNNLAPKTSNEDNCDLYICDYSDKDTSGEVYIHGMSYEQSQDCWFAYVPKTSTMIQFYYHSDTDQGWWAYNSWAGINPQQRPGTSYKYYFTHRVQHGTSYDGIGYWEGQDKVYLIRNGDIGSANKVFAYMYYNVGDDDYKKNAEPPGVQMTDTGMSDPRDTQYVSPIFEISTICESNPGYYLYVKFSGVWNDHTEQPKYGSQIPMCPGCYFDWKNNKWIGALSSVGREQTESVTPATVP